MGKKWIIAWLLAISMGICSFGQGSVHPSFSVITPDSIVSIASSQYQPGSFLRRIFMGTNYREVWQAKVTLPVFYFSQSGLTIKELGGGMQTKSLHVVDKQGKEWSLRTVDKDVSNAVMPVQSSLLRKVSQDLISAAFPYAAPIVGELAYAAGIHAAKPKIFYVADDSSLKNR